MYNKVILVGNLTKEVTLRYTQGNLPVATLRLAVNTQRQNNEETLFINAVVFGKQAEVCNQYLSKGDTVLVEGRLHERKWEQAEIQRSKIEIIVKNVTFLSKKGSEKQIPQTDIDDVPPEVFTEEEPF